MTERSLALNPRLGLRLHPIWIVNLPNSRLQSILRNSISKSFFWFFFFCNQNLPLKIVNCKYIARVHIWSFYIFSNLRCGGGESPLFSLSHLGGFKLLTLMWVNRRGNKKDVPLFGPLACRIQPKLSAELPSLWLHLTHPQLQPLCCLVFTQSLVLWFFHMKWLPFGLIM